MLSVVKESPGFDGIALAQREPRRPASRGILVKVKAAGVCGRDMQIYQWSAWMERRMRLPRVLGREAASVIIA